MGGAGGGMGGMGGGDAGGGGMGGMGGMMGGGGMGGMGSMVTMGKQGPPMQPSALPPVQQNPSPMPGTQVDALTRLLQIYQAMPKQGMSP